jgi:hypothetical protein
MPNHELASYPGTTSPTVGRSGRISARVAVVTDWAMVGLMPIGPTRMATATASAAMKPFMAARQVSANSVEDFESARAGWLAARAAARANQ